MKRFATSIVLTFALIVAQPHSAQSAEIAKSEYVEWNLGFSWLGFGVSGSHTDIQTYLPWYRYDPENAPFISSQAPLSIRTPRAVLLDFSKNDCVAIPLQIRREVAKNFATDTLNPLSLEFNPLILNNASSKVFELKPVLSIGPSDWANDSDLIEKQISVCKEIIGTSKKSLEGSYLTLAFVTKYERNISALQGEISKCGELLNGKCIFSVRAAGSIDILISNSRAVEQPNLYKSEMQKLQDFLDSKPCFPGGIGDQLLANIYCANAIRNIEILKKELPTIQAAADKAAADNLKLQQYEFDAVQLDYQKMMKRISDLKIKYPNNSSLTGIEKKMRNLPIVLGKDLNTAKYNIASVIKSLDISEKVWAATQKITITCLKGKVVKKVTGINPKCPSGYKKK